MSEEKIDKLKNGTPTAVWAAETIEALQEEVERLKSLNFELKAMFYSTTFLVAIYTYVSLRLYI